MTRTEAIETLALAEVAQLNPAERAEQLTTMLLEDWASDPAWSTVPAEVRHELEGGVLRAPASDARYDSVLMVWLRDRYAAATNAFLMSRLAVLGTQVVVDGAPRLLEPCPCCGARTLGRRGDYDICPVCWWEDDGQDNDRADLGSGPNHVSLTQARANFLLTGIFDPERVELRKLQHPVMMYEQGRRFVLSSDGRAVREDEAGWTSTRFSRPRHPR